MTTRISAAALLGCLCMLMSALVLADTSRADFGFEPASVSSRLLDDAGNPITQAASHTSQVVSMRFKTRVDSNGFTVPDQTVRDVSVDLPPGLVGDATAVPACEPSLFAQAACPPASQVGMAVIKTQLVPFEPESFTVAPLYLIEPERGQLARLGFKEFQNNVSIEVKLRTDGDYGLTASSHDLPSGLLVDGVRLMLWRVPADPANDRLRGLHGGATCFGDPDDLATVCSQVGAGSGVEQRPFMSAPTSCGAPLLTAFATRSWTEPERWVQEQSSGPVLSGCEQVPFVPSIGVRAESSQPDTPSGLDLSLAFDQTGTRSPKGLTSSPLK
ncbi:MAG: hypothetical protein ABUL56_02795, partial [Actinomycetota bacterium]